MADFIKKLIEKKKKNDKFKAAGPGYKLSDTTVKEEPKVSKGPAKRAEPSSEAKQAGMAALARYAASTSTTPGFSMSFGDMPSQVRKELQEEAKSSDSTQAEKCKPLLAVQGVYYRCPLIGPEVLSKDEWKAKIRMHLNQGLEEERGLASCLIIHSCNKNKEKVEQCVLTLSTYIENILLHPNEEKYQKIRISNKIVQDKVVKVEGAMDFLLAAGFENKTLEFKGAAEDFLVFNPEVGSEETLKLLLDTLQDTEPITLELDRNVQVLLPAQASVRVQIPDDFYALTQEELKREQQLRTERLDSAMQLKTKAMREKEEQREMKKYKFAVIRIRFPDGMFLQGTFGVYEKFRAVKEFLDEALYENGRYTLISSGFGNQFTEADEDSSLLELRLVPATLLIFAWDQDESISTFIKPELMEKIDTI